MTMVTARLRKTTSSITSTLVFRSGMCSYVQFLVMTDQADDM